MPTITKSVYLPQSAFVNVSSFNTNVSPRTSKEIVRSKTGVPYPRWRDVIRNGGNATTTFNGTRENCTLFAANTYVQCTKDYLPPGKSEYEMSYSSCYGQYYDATLQFVSSPSAPTTSASNQSLSRLYDAIRAQTTHVQSGVMLGELRETLRTIGSVTAKVAKGVRGYLDVQNKFLSRYLGNLTVGPKGSPVRPKSGKGSRSRQLPPGDWKDVRKGLADNWLEFAFGIQPLLSDVRDHAEAAARFSSDSVHTKVRGYGNSIASASVSVTYVTPGANTPGLTTTKNVQRAEVINRAGMRFTSEAMTFGTPERLRSLLGFKLEDFVPTVWNLLPYSFLVDYFSNVGDLLSAITTDTSGVTWTCTTDVQTSERNVQGRAAVELITNSDGKSYSGGGSLGGLLIERKSVFRRNAGLGVPTPEFKIPPLFTDYGVNLQIVNILALLQGGSGGHR